MPDLQRVRELRVIEESQRVEKLLLEACDSDTSTLLRLSEISIYPCGYSSKPILTVSCKSREVTEAIGLKQAYIKSTLKQLTGCQMGMSVHYKIPEGTVFFDTEGEVTPAKWYLCNRRECGNMKIPLY